MADRDLGVAIVGAGKLARALVPALCAAGIPVRALAARRISAAADIAVGRRIRRTRSPEKAAALAPVLLLAVPDRELAGLVRRLAASSRVDWSRRVVLHHAGALGPALLTPLARRGAAIGVLHPMQTLGALPKARVALRGSACRIEGDRGGVRAARRLAKALGLIPLPIRIELDDTTRAAYHAASSVVANDFVALFSLASGLLASIEVPPEAARKALVALARGTLDQLAAGGVPAALTGPAVRGDLPTVEAQIRALAGRSTAGAAAHAWLAVELAGLAGPDEPAATKRRLKMLARRARIVGRGGIAGL